MNLRGGDPDQVDDVVDGGEDFVERLAVGGDADERADDDVGDGRRVYALLFDGFVQRGDGLAGGEVLIQRDGGDGLALVALLVRALCGGDTGGGDGLLALVALN